MLHGRDQIALYVTLEFAFFSQHGSRCKLFIVSPLLLQMQSSECWLRLNSPSSLLALMSLYVSVKVWRISQSCCSGSPVSFMTFKIKDKPQSVIFSSPVLLALFAEFFWIPCLEKHLKDPSERTDVQMK